MKSLRAQNPKVGDVFYIGQEESYKPRRWRKHIPPKWSGEIFRMRKGYTPWQVKRIVKRGCVVEIKKGHGSPHRRLLDWSTKVTKTGYEL